MTDGVLRTVQAWTGVATSGCPWRAFFDPFVRRVMDLHAFWEPGTLAFHTPDPSNRLVEGVSLYNRVLNAAHRERMKQDREIAEAERKAAEATRGGR